MHEVKEKTPLYVPATDIHGHAIPLQMQKVCKHLQFFLLHCPEMSVQEWLHFQQFVFSFYLRHI